MGQRRMFGTMGLVVACLLWAGAALVWAQATAPTKEQQFQQQAQANLQRAYAAEAQRDGLTKEAVSLRVQLETMQARLVPACVEAVEAGNKGKTVNPDKNFLIENKKEQ